MPDEIWRSVPSYPYLTASSHGRLRMEKRSYQATYFDPKTELSYVRPVNIRGGLLKPWIKAGYLVIQYQYLGKKTELLVHRVIASTFLTEPFPGATVDHLDSNRLNNRVENLEWVSRSENAIRAHLTGTATRWKTRTTPLTATDYQSIHELRESGLTMAAIADRFSVSTPLICNIINGKTRKSLPL